MYGTCMFLAKICQHHFSLLEGKVDEALKQKCWELLFDWKLVQFQLCWMYTVQRNQRNKVKRFSNEIEESKKKYW